MALAVAGCGGGGTETDTTTQPPRRSYGPAKSHPYWWASEVLLKEVEEVQTRFEDLRPGDFRGKLSLMAQVERLQIGCENGYGLAGCRRQGEISRIVQRMQRAIVSPQSRRAGLTADLQIALLRYRQQQDEDGAGSAAAQIAGLHALALAMRLHVTCGARPTCPWEESARVEATLRRELLSRREPASEPDFSVKPKRYRPGDLDCRARRAPGTVGGVGEDVVGVRVDDFVACYGPPLRTLATADGSCLLYRQRGTRSYWRFCVRNRQIRNALGGLPKPG